MRTTDSNCERELQIANCRLKRSDLRSAICSRGYEDLWRFQRNQDGTISILSVFAVLGLTMLLGMVMNVGRQVDGKIRMQNAADAAAYSGGLVLARGMNSLAFTNHLLCEVFAMTAWMREAHDRHCDPYVPDSLAAWKKEGGIFAGSTFPKFHDLGSAITQKVPLEQALVKAFSEWAAAIADGGALPMMETILREHLITDYQRAVVAAIPDMAQNAAMTVAGQNGQPDYGRGAMTSVLWWQGPPAGHQQIAGSGWLASIAADPNDNPTLQYASDAHAQRDQLAQQYLGLWNNQVLAFFDYGAKMSQYGQLWRSFTCGQLQKLLSEYSDTNLPFVIRNELQPSKLLSEYESCMDTNFSFMAVVKWGAVRQLSPGLFRSPIAGDSVAYAQVRVFVPTSRLGWYRFVPGTDVPPMGGAPGWQWPSDPTSPTGPATWEARRQIGVSTQWDLLNEHWTCQLVPATHPNVLTILQTALPALRNVNPQDLEQISSH
jgi:hypothetical protein